MSFDSNDNENINIYSSNNISLSNSPKQKILSSNISEKTSDNNIILLPSQQHALEEIINNLSTAKIILLEGPAGTGKTTLTKCIINYFNSINKNKYNICAIAPTHKARRVIESVINKNSLFKIPTYTVASALSKIREHSYIGSKNFSKTNAKKLNIYNLILIDEVSMINDNDMKILLDFIIKQNKNCIIIGDSNQIPSPSSQFEFIKDINIISNTNSYNLCSESKTVNSDSDSNNNVIQNIIQKKNSYVFTDPYIYKIKLTDIVRQSLDSPIIRLSHYIKDNLNISLSIKDLTNSICNNDLSDLTQNIDNNTSKSKENLLICYKNMFIKYSEIYDTYKKLYDSVDSIIDKSLIRIITYTNSSVRTHNLEIRRILGYNDTFVKGDIMMGYTNIDYPNLLIENGQDYIISDIILTENWSINNFNNLKGHLITLDIMNEEYFDSISLYDKNKQKSSSSKNDEDDTKVISVNLYTPSERSQFLESKNVNICDENTQPIKKIVIKNTKHELTKNNNTDLLRQLFFIDIYAVENYEFIKQLIKKALKVNTIHSTKNDYFIYKELKDKVLFIEDIYFYNKCVYTETTMKENHPLLFTCLSELISTNGEKNVTTLYEKIEKKYPGIIDIRLSDNKLISENEMLVDKYKVIEKDIYYGYAITAHKSQGSTYNSVIVDEFDFNKITNKWNYKYNALEYRVKEKNQLRYVAYTRAKKELYIVCKEETKETEDCFE